MGDNTTVDSTAIVAPGVVISEGASVAALAYVGAGATLEKRSLVGPRATVVDATVLEDATIGAGAIVVGPLVVGIGAVVEPGAVVMDDVPAHAIVVGNPAAVVGYTQPDETMGAPFVVAPSDAGESAQLAGAWLIRMRSVVDIRGSLAVAELGAGLPFTPRRVFLVYGAPNSKIRGSHAHRAQHQLLIAASGSLTVAIDDGASRGQVVLDNPSVALHIPPMVWATQYNYSPDATLAVLASDVYDETDYIRDYHEYLELLHV